MTILSDAVALIDGITLGLGLQASGTKRVTLKSFAGDGGVGAPAYSPPLGKKYDAVVDKRQRLVRGFSGQMVTANTTVIFLKPSIVVKENDVIVLSDGSGGEIIGTSSPVDASGQLLTEAYLG